jgi:hypothetical protein
MTSDIQERPLLHQQASQKSAEFAIQCGKTKQVNGGLRSEISSKEDQMAAAVTEVGSRQRKEVSVTLFIPAGLLILLILIRYGDDLREDALGSIATYWRYLLQDLIIASIYIGLGIWARKQPLLPAAIGLAFYAVLALLSTILNLIALGITGGFALIAFSVGSFFKVLIALLLIRAVRIAYNYSQSQQLIQSQPPEAI